MNLLWLVIGVAAVAGLVAAGSSFEYRNAVVLGIAGPAVAAGASWFMTTRTWAREHSALLPWMLRAFWVKALFFVAYVGVVLGVFGAGLRPFVLSFTVTFLATHLAEAFELRRLMAPVLAPRDGASGRDGAG
jgi:hypothetical protein